MTDEVDVTDKDLPRVDTTAPTLPKVAETVAALDPVSEPALVPTPTLDLDDDEARAARAPPTVDLDASGEFEADLRDVQPPRKPTPVFAAREGTPVRPRRAVALGGDGFEAPESVPKLARAPTEKDRQELLHAAMPYLGYLAAFGLFALVLLIVVLLARAF